MDGDVTNSTQTSNSSTLGTLAADKLITAINDPIAQWDVLSEDEVNLIKKRCEELLDWFTFLEVENLTNYEVVVPSDYLQRRQNKPCFDPHRMKDVADRFAEKGSIDFEDEFGMTREQLILVVLVGIMEEENKRNAKFEILCEALQLDKAVYHMVKKLLAADSNSTLTPKQLIVQTLCSPIDCCLALTMAYCEVSGWPYSCDWDAITYTFKNWTEEDQKVFNQIIEEEAKRQWNATKAFVMDPRSTDFRPPEHMTNCALMEGQLKALTSTADKVHAEMEELIKSMSKTALAEKHEAVVKERQEAISNLVPANMRDRPRLTDEELERLDKEIEEVRARMMAVQKPSEWPAPPEDGLAGRLVLAEGDYCLARKEDLASLAVGQILNRISATSYRVTFVETGDVEEVESADIAVPAVPMYDPDMKRTNYIGLRVAALVASPYFYNRPMWSTGTVGTLPNTAHNKEFLIFFDDGFEQYVQAAFESSDDDAMKVSAIKGDLLQQFTKKIRLLKILPLARQSLASNGIDIDKGGVYQLIRQNPERRRFIQKYFEKYPDWPLVRMKKPSPPERPAQAVVAYNSNGDRVTAYVVSTNRALCVLRFPPRSASYGAGCFNYPCTTPGHVHVDETIFRGSSRLHAVNLEHFGSNNMSARRMAKNRSQFDVVQPGPCPDRLKTSSIMARKSSAPVRSEGGPEDVINYEMDPQTLALRRKKEAQFEIRPYSEPLPPVKWHYHTECTQICLGGLERDPAHPQFNKCSPLHIPILCGWRRVLYMHESSLRRVSEGRILYRAPCGRSLVSKQCVASYLKITGSELTIDLFCFDPVIETKTFVHVDDSFVKTPDFAQGLEHLPIPAVNTIDDEDPPTTISRDYCSGCSCTDDCSDPLKCECQRLTVAMVRRLAKSFRPARGEYGYSYRKLLGKTITGVFECNDNCGCQQKRCYNRVVQQPIRYPIQIYKTAQSGWGVRAMCDIPAGAFIANYVGALLTDSLADALHGEDEYFADLDLNDAVENEKATTLEKCGYLDLGIGSEEEEDQNPKQKRSSEDDGIGSDTSSQSSSASEEEEPKMKRKRKKKEEVENVGQRRKKLNQAELEKIDAAAAVGDDTMFKWADYFGENNTLFVVDAKKKGNVGRFLNHSCDPNVQVQHVFVDTHDLRLPWSSFFAIRNIKAGEELCWNYGYSPEAIDPDRPRHRQLFCKCGAATCRGRLL
ncbi:hypothetical protein Q1695_016266 [Nippostrongylus brasiliensis]|nr:hypothetical protein Q1695_016266 [Nippostrongylus brasiliensis]